MIPRQVVGAALVAVLASIPVYAQVVREDGQKSIAGAIGGTHPRTASWTFKSPGGEILFASLDAEIYRKSEHHEDHLIAAAAEESCSDEASRFCLQVIDSSQNVICEVSRPAPPPGWQIDPRMACVIPEKSASATYSIRVSATSPEGACSPSALAPPVASTRPFLLNVSLRRVAPSGTSIHQAVAQSGNRF